jgi:hypothetical protein
MKKTRSRKSRDTVPFTDIEADSHLNMTEAGWLPILRLTHYLNMVEAGWLPILKLTHYLNMVDAGWFPILRLTFT